MYLAVFLMHTSSFFPDATHLLLTDQPQVSIALILTFLDFPRDANMSKWKYILPFNERGKYVPNHERAPEGKNMNQFLTEIKYQPRVSIRLPAKRNTTRKQDVIGTPSSSPRMRVAVHQYNEQGETVENDPNSPTPTGRKSPVSTSIALQVSGGLSGQSPRHTEFNLRSPSPTGGDVQSADDKGSRRAVMRSSVACHSQNYNSSPSASSSRILFSRESGQPGSFFGDDTEAMSGRQASSDPLRLEDTFGVLASDGMIEEEPNCIV